MNGGPPQLGQPTVRPARTSASIYEFALTSGPSDSQGRNGTYIWTPPTDCTWLEFFLLGGGAGGGSGQRGSTGSVRSGGGSGAAGGSTWAFVPREWVTSPLTIVVGSGGAGGASITTDSTAGSQGTAGGATTVSTRGVILLAAGGGRGGNTGSGAGQIAIGPYTYATQGFAGLSGGAASVATYWNQIGPQPQAGAPGGGANASNVYQTGPSIPVRTGAFVFDYSQHVANLATATRKSGGDAGNGVPGGAGVDGQSYGAPGGGGGSSSNGFASGAGGNGFGGYARITCL